MNREFMDALEQIEREKGISKEILLDAIETALASAYKRDQKVAQSIEVRVDSGTGAFHVYTHKTVVDEVEDENNEISLEDAQKINPNYELGDLVEFEVFPKEFGRIAAQTAKQVVVQRIREAERSIIYDEFINRVGDLITGVVQRFEQRNIFVDLGRIEGILPANEQMPNERYEQGMRIKTYVVEVKKTTKGPQVLLSRTRTGLLKRLFELEVPEIQDGIVEIKSISREPGYRSKIAVASRDHQIDPVGACVGTRGIRVQMIVRELKGEKIDVIPWDPDPVEFIINALSPAKVSDVKILPSKKTAIVIVPDYQLSLAIGKEGQNARLAAKLTGWRIDIKSETQAEEQAEEIERLVCEEIGFRDYETEIEESTPVDGETPGLEETPGIETDAAEGDAEWETEDYSEPIPEPDEDNEEEIVIKKKTKKSKAVSKHLAKIELDDEPISLDEGYFFVDVLKEREAEKSNDDASEEIPQEAGSDYDSSSEQEGFTIGQLFGDELKKARQKSKKTKGE
ncbi:MAG: transcription termination/antitermination protein NusA [Firmicutes bacterium]|nr:transcription termination/antitermination protein NusA [Bacillota bacterium]